MNSRLLRRIEQLTRTTRHQEYLIGARPLGRQMQNMVT